jgi:GMP synthase-like glutamine amidotransferase
MSYVAILETGVPPAGLDQTYGTYPHMFQNVLSREGRAFKVFRALEGELPDLDDVEEGAIAGVVITGSPAGVYEDHAWITNLIDWLKSLDREIPVVGICFGHQIMAQAFGGQVEKSHRGWGVGLHEYHIHDNALWQDLTGAAGPPAIRVAVTHQDQVVQKPHSAVVLAGSEFTPFGALYYTDRKGLSFQCHPEFCADFAQDLLISRRGVRIDAHLVDSAVETLKGQSHRDTVIGAISRFLDA